MPTPNTPAATTEDSSAVQLPALPEPFGSMPVPGTFGLHCDGFTADHMRTIQREAFELGRSAAMEAAGRDARDAKRWRAVAHVFHIVERIGERTGNHAVRLTASWFAWIDGKHETATDAVDAYAEFRDKSAAIDEAMKGKQT